MLAFVPLLMSSPFTKIGIIHVYITYPHASSVRGKHLFSDTQVRTIGSMKPEICTKMLKNLSERLAAKFSLATTLW